jgi:predicted outer membrane repeat protein
MDNQRNYNHFVSVIVLVALFLMAAPPAWADTYYVPDPIATIQDAIDIAVNGDVILVADDTYKGDGNRDIDFLGKAITVKSVNGPTNCIIDCQASKPQMHRGFYFHTGESSNSILEGFKIINGVALAGAAICCDNDSSPTIKNCVIADCDATDIGGGGIYCGNSAPEIVNCLITGNTSDNVGGAIMCWKSSLVLKGSIICGNTAQDAAAIACLNQSNPAIENCTITDNQAGGSGGAIYTEYDSSPTLTNCILWNDTPDEISVVSGTPVVNYSNIQNGWSGLGNDNIDADPLFVDASADDYHLHWDSPCINTGDPAGDYTGQVDIDGDSRVHLGTVDMGADETGSNPADFDESGNVTLTDFAELAAAWLISPADPKYDISQPADNLIDLSDLTVLADYWLWQAPWYIP